MSSEVNPRRAQGWQNHTIPDSDRFKLAAAGWLARGFEVFELSEITGPGMISESQATGVVAREGTQGSCRCSDWKEIVPRGSHFNGCAGRADKLQHVPLLRSESLTVRQPESDHAAALSNDRTFWAVTWPHVNQSLHPGLAPSPCGGPISPVSARRRSRAEHGLAGCQCELERDLKIFNFQPERPTHSYSDLQSALDPV